MCLLEEARTCNAVDLAAEKLFLDPIGAHHCRRHDDEGRFRTRAPLVDHPCSDVLSDTGRSGDEHPAAGGSDALQGRTDVVDGG
jgi:hypothetical protein